MYTQKKVAILFASGFEEIEALFPLDFLRRAEIPTVSVSTENCDSIKGSHGIEVKMDCHLNNIKTSMDFFNAIIIPGGLPGSQNLSENSMVTEFLWNHHKKNSILAAICAAPYYVLGKHGFLQDTNYTCYPSLFQDAEQLLGHAPQQELVVYDKSILTSQGVGTVAEFTYKLLCLLIGSCDFPDKIMKSSLFNFTKIHNDGEVKV